MKKNILITGMPRSGKSTILKKIIYECDKKVGFVTLEVRNNSERIGFEVEAHTGQKIMLANIDFKGNLKVSRYFIDINNLNKLIPYVCDFQENDVLYLDEIGQMQLFSESFKQLVTKYLNSSNICVATISKIFSDSFIEELKNRKDVILVEITEETRAEKETYVRNLLKKVIKAKKYSSEPDRFTIRPNDVSVVTDHGVRHLNKINKEWTCSCDFFKDNGLCSHVIALEEVLSNHRAK